ncbi:MAG: type II secretion system protein [Candidatus Paceibacterota bacterium]
MKKGFTLLELLIVIGILAILAATTVLVLNPAELLKQARDSQRISDLATLNSALGMYVTDVSSPALGSDTLCYVNVDTLAAGCGGRHGSKTSTYDVDRTVDGTGWLPVDFTDISGGSPLPTIPVDPTNTTTYYYSYSVSSTPVTYELNVAFESAKYMTDLDLDGKDGGNSTSTYEIGTEPGLDI